MSIFNRINGVDDKVDPAPANSGFYGNNYDSKRYAELAKEYALEAACAAQGVTDSFDNLVYSVNGKTKDVILSAEDVGAVAVVNGKVGTNIDLSASDVGAVATVNGKSGEDVTLVAADIADGVYSVNSKKGNVELVARDIKDGVWSINGMTGDVNTGELVAGVASVNGKKGVVTLKSRDIKDGVWSVNGMTGDVLVGDMAKLWTPNFTGTGYISLSPAVTLAGDFDVNIKASNVNSKVVCSSSDAGTELGLYKDANGFYNLKVAGTEIKGTAVVAEDNLAKSFIIKRVGDSITLLIDGEVYLKHTNSDTLSISYLGKGTSDGDNFVGRIFYFTTKDYEDSSKSRNFQMYNEVKPSSLTIYDINSPIDPAWYLRFSNQELSFGSDITAFYEWAVRCDLKENVRFGVIADSLFMEYVMLHSRGGTYKLQFKSYHSDTVHEAPFSKALLGDNKVVRIQRPKFQDTTKVYIEDQLILDIQNSRYSNKVASIFSATSEEDRGFIYEVRAIDGSGNECVWDLSDKGEVQPDKSTFEPSIRPSSAYKNLSISKNYSKDMWQFVGSVAKMVDFEVGKEWVQIGNVTYSAESIGAVSVEQFNLLLAEFNDLKARIGGVHGN